MFSLSRPAFQVNAVYKLKRHGVLKIARQKASFLVASLSLLAFVVGNMVGQHGWYAFWKSVLGKEDDAVIAFVGTVPPVERVPDYSRWSQYGGNSTEHTYRQVPHDLLVPLPAYDPVTLRDRSGENMAKAVYSIGNLGSYASGEDRSGSHVGVDIRVPVGTPVVSIANGVVEKVSIIESGYGHHILIRHPNVPDPLKPGTSTTLYSVYAHLSTVLVREGQIVHKGQEIAASGETGLASGPHLHFQIDRSEAPYHPYWPFTSEEADAAKMTFTQAINAGFHQDRGIEYTVSPLLYVQQHASDIGTIAAAGTSSSSSSALRSQVTYRSESERLRAVRSNRLQSRIAKAGSVRPLNTSVVPVGGGPASASSSSQATTSIDTVKTVATEDSKQLPVAARSNTDVDHLMIEHSGHVSRSWQKVKIIALDSNGDRVRSPTFAGRLYIVPEFAEAEIRPRELTSLDFVDGIATVNVMARGTKTLFISTKGAFNTLSAPMLYER